MLSSFTDRMNRQWLEFSGRRQTSSSDAVTEQARVTNEAAVTTSKKRAAPAEKMSVIQKPGGGRFRVRDTLQTQPHAPTVRLLPSPLEVRSSRGSNVKMHKQHAEIDKADFYEPDVGPYLKRQKLSNDTTSKSIPSSEAVDLTMDDSQEIVDDHFGVPVAHNGRALRNRSQEENAFSAAPPIRGTNLKDLERYTRVDPERKQGRRKPERQSSSQGSERATPNGSLSQDQRIRDKNHSSPIMMVDEVPTIDLDRGIDTRHVLSKHRRAQESLPLGSQARTKRLSAEDDMKSSGDVLQTMTRRQPAVEQPSVVVYEDPPLPKRRRCIPQDVDRGFDTYLNQERMRPPPKFRDIVVRAPTDNPSKGGASKRMEAGSERAPNGNPLKARASQRMKAESEKLPVPVQMEVQIPVKAKPARETFGSSDDELAGAGNMIASQASRRVDLSVENGEAVRRGSRKTTVDRSVSPRKRQAQSRRATSSETNNEEDPDELRIPITKLWCRSCIAEYVFLVWDLESRSFFVERDDVPLKISSRGQLVSIGCAELSQWTHAEKDSDIFAVYIKGPSTRNSNGHIIIEFDERNGQDLCYDTLLDATRDEVKLSTISRDRMEKLVKTQGRDILQDHQLRSVSAPARTERNIPAVHARKVGREHQLQDVERIKYDDDSPPGSRSASRMRNDRDDYATNGTARTLSRIFDKESSKFSGFDKEDRRRSTRQVKPIKPKAPTPPPPERWTRENNPERWTQSVVYPQSGARRATVDFQDLERLDEGEFLNDNVIGFALRYIEENMAEEHKTNVHFFNSFFYTALTTKNGKRAFNYNAVKRWTKNIDLFRYPYVVVPINIDLHWFVAIICNLPDLSRKRVGAEDEEGNMEHNGDGSQDSGRKVDEGAAEVVTPAIEKLSISDDEKNSDIFEFDDNDKVKETPTSPQADGFSNNKSKKKLGPGPKRYSPDTPAIITLDSFGSTHSTETRYLKDYLNAEAEAKRAMVVGTKDLQGMTAKGIPEQTNFCDCGVYLVGYIEEFAKDPRAFVSKVLRRELDSKSDFRGFDPSTKREEVRNSLLRLYEMQEAERRGESVPQTVMEAKKGPHNEVQSAQDRSSTPTRVNAHAHSDIEMSKPPALPARSSRTGSKAPSPIRPMDGNDDIQLEVEVPRPLSRDTAERSSNETELSPNKDRENMVAASSEYRMLHNGDDFETGPHRENSDADMEESATGDDLIGPLQHALEENQAATHGQSELLHAADEGVQQRADFKSPHRREGLRTRNRSIVSLDAMDGGETEVPESPSPYSLREGKSGRQS